MNKNQKIVLAIFVPIIIFFVALMIANSVGVTGHWHISKPIAGYKTHTSIRYTHNPFDWEKTWYVWLIYSAFCCLFEFLLFRDKKKRNRKD